MLNPPPKVLHCVERMHTNAIENWLNRTFQFGLNNGHQLDWYFHVHLPDRGAIEDKFHNVQSRIIRSNAPLGRPLAFIKDFSKTCRDANYDIIHVHADVMSAMYLIAAKMSCKAKTIVHVHNTAEAIPSSSALKRSVLRMAMRQVCFGLADRIVGISNQTLNRFLHKRPRRTERHFVHYLGIAPLPTQMTAKQRDEFRLSIGVPPTAVLLVFAGRMVPEKNPEFVLEVLRSVRHHNPHVYCIFAGDGSLRIQSQNYAKAIQLDKFTRFLGWRNDVTDIMQFCDVYIHSGPENPPEGFGVAVLEAHFRASSCYFQTE